MIIGWDIVIKPFSKWRPSAIFNFRNLAFWSHDLCLTWSCQCQPSTILDLLWRHDTSSEYSVLRSKHCVKFSSRLVYYFRILYILGVSCFILFCWKLPTQGQIFRVWGVNRGQISIFHFITQKGTALRDFATFEPLSVKICPGSLLYVGPRKN